jgi:hypothetical protein
MSHSTVLIIGEDPEAMLVPYDENTEVAPYREYDETARPEDHWAFKALTTEAGLSVDADWPAFVLAYNARYDDGEEKMFYDVEMDRIYSMSTYNPQSRWDWYQLGGRWTGFFKLKAGAQGDTGSPGLFTPTSKPGWADQARKGDIDLEGMRDAAGAEAAEFHAKATLAMAGTPPLVAWQKVREEMFPGDIDAARTFYHGQAGMKALFAAKIHLFDAAEYLCLDAPNPLLEHVTRARLDAGRTFAILDENGWHEKGRMGWWGVVHDETDTWPQAYQAIVDAAPDEALFSVYDVHI